MYIFLTFLISFTATSGYKTNYKPPSYPTAMAYEKADDSAMPTADDPDGDGIFGTAGKDYPIYNELPQTEFKCAQQTLPGYYADPGAQCQVFHICQAEGFQTSFLCPNGSIFNQQYFVCDWWYNFDCSKASSFYSLNSELFKVNDSPPVPASPSKSYSIPAYPMEMPPPPKPPTKSYSMPTYPKEKPSKVY